MRRARDRAVDVEEGALAGQPKARGILRQVQNRVLPRKRLARCQHRGVHGDAGWLPGLVPRQAPEEQSGLHEPDAVPKKPGSCSVGTRSRISTALPSAQKLLTKHTRGRPRTRAPPGARKGATAERSQESPKVGTPSALGPSSRREPDRPAPPSRRAGRTTPRETSGPRSGSRPRRARYRSALSPPGPLRRRRHRRPTLPSAVPAVSRWRP